MSSPPDEFETVPHSQLMATGNRTPPSSVTKATKMCALESPRTDHTLTCSPAPRSNCAPWSRCVWVCRGVCPCLVCLAHRQDDGVILKQCLRSSRPMETVFSEVAAAISRTPQEVIINRLKKFLRRAQRVERACLAFRFRSFQFMLIAASVERHLIEI